MDGWWCVRYGDALAWVEAPSAPQALLRSLDLRRMGDWTDDARRLVVFPQDDYPENAGPHDYTRAALSAEPSPPRRRARARRGVRAVHGTVLRIHHRDGHRARRGGERGARFRPLRCGRGDEGAVRA